MSSVRVKPSPARRTQPRRLEAKRRSLHADPTTPRFSGRGVVVRSANERRPRAGVARRARRARRGHGPRSPRCARGRLDGPLPRAGRRAGSAGVRGRGRGGAPGVRGGRSRSRPAGRQHGSGGGRGAPRRGGPVVGAAGVDRRGRRGRRRGDCRSRGDARAGSARRRRGRPGVSCRPRRRAAARRSAA